MPFNSETRTKSTLGTPQSEATQMETSTTQAPTSGRSLHLAGRLDRINRFAARNNADRLEADGQALALVFRVGTDLGDDHGHDRLMVLGAHTDLTSRGHNPSLLQCSRDRRHVDLLRQVECVEGRFQSLQCEECARLRRARIMPQTLFVVCVERKHGVAADFFVRTLDRVIAERSLSGILETAW